MATAWLFKYILVDDRKVYEALGWRVVGPGPYLGGWASLIIRRRPQMTAKATYPVNVIAKLLDLTPRRVQHLANEGVIPRAEKGRYELVSAVRGYIRYLRDRAMGKDGAVIPDIAARGGPTTLSLQTLNERITVILGPSWFLSEQHVDIQNGDPLVVDIRLRRPPWSCRRIFGETPSGSYSY